MLDIIIFAALVTVAFFTGRWLEKRHYASIRAREALIVNQPVMIDHFTAKEADILKTKFVGGSCVIAADRFKTLLGALRSLFGGNVAAYESLMDRARREAILRMREKAPDADMIVRTRIEGCVLHRDRVEVMAYGTAIYLRK